MYSSLKGMMGGGGTASIRRSFPTAPGETIERGDVVTVFGGELYRNAEQPVSEMPRFSPDVLYTQPDEECRAVHPIGGDNFIYIGTTDKQIRIYRVEAGAASIAVKAVQSIPVYGVEGINMFLFKPLTDETGIICYLEHNTNKWALMVIRWSGTNELLLGDRFESELYANGEPVIENVSDSSFLLVWHCTKAVPQRLKASVCTIGAGDAIGYHGYAMELEANETMHNAFAFSKLSENVFAVSYLIKASATQGTLVTRMLLVNAEGALVIGEKSTITTAIAAQAELRHLTLSPSKLVLISKLNSIVYFYTIVIKEGNVPIAGASVSEGASDSFYDAVKISEDRFMSAINFYPMGLLIIIVYDTTFGNTVRLFERVILHTVKGISNRLRFIPLGQSLFALTFNHETELNYAYTQAVMLKMTPIQTKIDGLNVIEQLTNVWDKEAAAGSFLFGALGTEGRFVAAGRGRLKLFRCGWSPTRFISAGIGEFDASSGDRDVNGRTLGTAVLSDGSIAVAYRERDTWHGKLSVFRPDGGGYRPFLSYTFSYSHVDNISVVELLPGQIIVSYKQRIEPAYDSKQWNRGDGTDEMKVLVASVTEDGLAGKTTTSFNLPESYLKSSIVKLDNGYLLHAGVTAAGLMVLARVVRYEVVAESVSFKPLEQSETIDYERNHVSAVLLGPRKAAIRSDIRMVIAEVGDNGELLVSPTYYFTLQNRETRAMAADGQGGLLQLTTLSGGANTLELTPYGCSGFKLYQTGDTVSCKRNTTAVLTDLVMLNEGAAAFVYREIWASGRMASKGEPHQQLRLGVLGIEASHANRGDGLLLNARHYPFPGSIDTLPFLLPLGDGRTFCIGKDSNGNQIYMLAYSDGERLSYGKPYLSPHGIAVTGGEDGANVEVIMRGIAEYDEPLSSGAVYYSGRDGKLTRTVNGLKVGVAISERELLIE